MTSVGNNSAGEDNFLAQRRLYHRRGVKSQHRSLNRRVRACAKQLTVNGQIGNVFPNCPQDHSQLDKASLRPHIQQDVHRFFTCLGKSAYTGEKILNLDGPTPREIDYQSDGRDLAYSDIELPSDQHRLVRRPTLEREDAFRDESTAKGKVRIRRRAEPANDDQQVAELYRMGLLYDTEQDRSGEMFSLNSIQHDEPLYSIRPAKRTQKHKRAAKGIGRPLHLDLSFTDLGDDEALTKYLMALNPPKADQGTRFASRELVKQQPPLRVVYELASSQPTFDVDTSQPPDLVTDLLSDYDCLSDGELDDTPSQREEKGNTEKPPFDAWVILGDNP